MKAIMIIGEFLRSVNPDCYEKAAAVFFFRSEISEGRMFRHMDSALMPKSIEKVAEIQMKEEWQGKNSSSGIGIGLEEAAKQIVIHEL
ncbi:MAG TPA: hypothetical protein DD454_03250 [Candidatus Moranbacteria bacterium]|nr:hypothetical protein [Candidatus Moranbacteria bacterium]